MTRERTGAPVDVQAFEAYVRRAAARFAGNARVRKSRAGSHSTGSCGSGSSATSAPARAMRSSRVPPR